MDNEKRIWSSNTCDFLDLFDGHHIFVAMPEYNGVPWHLHSGYEKSTETLRSKNEEGWGVFFTVNELDESLDEGKHRTKKMVTRCRSVFMDDDIPRDAPRDDFPLQPSLVVCTSPGKYHYYWLIDGGVNGDMSNAWQDVQNGIVYEYDGDSKAKDVTRYLRLPGYTHNKDMSKRFRCVWSGSGAKYPWLEIVSKFPPMARGPVVGGGRKDGTRVERDGGGNLTGISKTIKEYEDAIVSGEDFHGGLLSLSYQMVKEGVGERYVVMALQGLMNRCSDEIKSADRWSSRYEDIERIVKGAGERILSGVEENGNITVEDVVLEDEGIRDYNSDMPWPPGLLGKLAQDAYDMQRFQYYEVAVVSALGLVAGVVGRKFNINGTGLNLYLTLIMRTGMGKDSISEFINGTLISLNDVGQASSFCGPARFTGPKGVVRALESARSQVCVFTEAGLLLKSKTGDKEGLSRVLLGLYGKSGNNSVSGAEAFSKDEDSLSMLRAPALTIVNEATPETLLDAFKDGQALERGELPRQSIYRINSDKPYMNFNASECGLGESSVGRLKHLIKICASVQAVEDPKAYSMMPTEEVRKDMMNTMEHYVDMENDTSGSDSVRSIMSSRAFVKAMKFAAIASVFNHTDAVVNMREWKWGKDMVEYEMGGLNNFFQGSTFGDIFSDLIKRHVGRSIIKMLKGEYRDKKKSVSRADAKKGHFPLYGLTQILKNNKDINALNDDIKFRSRAITGTEKVIDYMVRTGLIYKVDEERRRMYGITESFKLFMK